ncbi:zinc finger protein 135-like isoform X3 [Pleurodeles waltl]|uniref:zinc finger protein 135-like isoform X3 n=1 Tax=Pleurodeles waltl TaxID=8319 RepID=UPI00370949C4
MAARKQLSRQEADEDPVTFCDVVARFSEDEWKLLHLWQKDLYRNVMKEIHKVLITLGDSVITSDNILRVDEEFELDSVKPCVSEDGGSSTDPTLAPDVKPPLTSIGINEEGETYHMGVQEYQRGESPEVKPPVAPIGFNEEGETYRIGSQPYRRGEYLELKPAVAFTGIKEEEETPPIGIQDYPRGESSNSLGNRNKNGKRKGSISLKHHVSESFCKSVTKKSEVYVAQIDQERRISATHMQPGSDCKISVETPAHWQPNSTEHTSLNACQTAEFVQRSEPFYISDTKARNNITPYESNTQQNCEPQNEKTDPTINYHVRRQPPRVKRHPCAECGKKFTSISSLIKHERVHTGERPFHCEICGESFNQLGALHRHQKRHTGERPYPCYVCGKRFSRKDTLLGHQKTHSKAQQNSELNILEID